MANWTYKDVTPHEDAFGIAGYSVLDAVGLPIGYVSGWVKDPDHRVRMLNIVVRDWFEEKEYLIPTGSITLISDERSQIQLRQLTRQSLPKYCLTFDGELPEPKLLKGLIRFFPDPHPGIEDRLARSNEAPPRPRVRITVLYNDKTVPKRSVLKRSATSLPAQRPAWVRLDRLVYPEWTLLSEMAG